MRNCVCNKRGYLFLFSIIVLLIFSSSVFAGGGCDTRCTDPPASKPYGWAYRVFVGGVEVIPQSEFATASNSFGVNIGSLANPLPAICAREGDVTIRVGTRCARASSDNTCCDTTSDHWSGAWDVASGGTDYYISWDGNADHCKCKTGASNRWDLGGDVPNQNCCGDDSSEYVRTRVCHSGCTDASDAANRACCDEDDCVWNDNCYDPRPGSSDHNGWENTAYAITSGTNLAMVCTANGLSAAAWGNPDYHYSWCQAVSDDLGRDTAWNVGGGDALAEDAYYTNSGTRVDYCKIGSTGHPSLECCCGDDSNEYVGTKKASADVDWPSEDTPENQACCNNANDCVWQENCYADSDVESGLQPFGNDNLVYCKSGSDEWDDCDNNCGACGLTSANSGTINIGEYSDFNVAGCCGDDYGEQLAKCNDQSDKPDSSCGVYSTTDVCCDDPTDCVDDDGFCRDSQTFPHASFGGSTCVDGVWYNLDNKTITASCGNGVCDGSEDGISGSPNFCCDCVGVVVGDNICSMKGICEDVTGGVPYPKESPADCYIGPNAQFCGDGVVTQGERCDGENFNGFTCNNIGNFLGGTLNCVGCQIDTSDCTGVGGIPDLGACGDSIINSGETCDTNNLNGLTCLDFGFDGGTLTCDACNIDTTGCTGGSLLCGNGLMDTGEQCDGNDLNGLTCGSFGFSGSGLKCVGCQIDTSECSGGTTGVCGDSLMHLGETCDNSVPGGLSCVNLGFAGGSGLRCDAACNIDTSGCFGDSGGSCGDGNINQGEYCDSSDLRGQSCQSMGFSSGSLSCAGDCTIDSSSCQPYRCGDSECTTWLGETYVTCPQDCSLGGGACGDRICALGEFCSACDECCNYDPINSPTCSPNNVCCEDNICAWGENNQICSHGDCPDEHINYAGYCGDDNCSITEDAYTCSNDCDWSSCGNLICEWGETEGTDSGDCEGDCGIANCGDIDGCYGTCGDGACSLAETGLTCPQDCFPHDYATYCDINGCCFENGVCEWGETHDSCGNDCPSVSYCGTCGDNVCSVCESPLTCIEDCGNYGGCGDNYCSIFEALRILNCPQDCPFEDATQGDDGLGYNAGGDIPGGWCGNDPGEFYRYCISGQGNPGSQCGVVPDGSYNEYDACCDLFSDCVTEIGTCFEAGAGRKTFAHSFCSMGRWNDPDLLQSFCEDATGGTRDDTNVVFGIAEDGLSHWLVSSRDDNGVQSCCGDDANEIYMDSVDSPGMHGDGTFGCCNSTQSCVYNNACYERGDRIEEIPNRICGPDRQLHLATDFTAINDTVTFPVSSMSYNGQFMSCNVANYNNQEWIPPDECKGSMKGIVVDKWGDPLENAKVELHRYDDYSEEFIDYTDATGEFSFSSIWASYYDIVIEGEVYGLYKAVMFLPAGPDTRVDKDLETDVGTITLSDASSCRPDCLDIDTDVCNKDCEGRNGCHFKEVGGFTSEDVAAACDLQAQGSRVVLGAGNDVFCCGSDFEASKSGTTAIRDLRSNVKSDPVCLNGENAVVISSIVNFFGSPGTINVLVCG
jgi:hypothetical protein